MEIISRAAAYVLGIIQTVSLADIIDIAVITLIVYKIMTFFRRTGSARVIRGILLLIGLMWLSTLLKLNVVTFLMGKTIELGFLAIIIIFQPELRRMLETVGSSSNITQLLTRNPGSKVLEAAIRQTVQACTELSKSRTGALIVFEREIKLDDPIKTGTMLEANVQAELLKNIFYPKAPLHDGAVIIRESRIVAAGCMLPLSANPNLSRELGTRHRASLGISELSDAVVAVVSEETGAISVAVEGMLKRHLAPDTFEKLLRNELIPDEDERKRKNIFGRAKGSLYDRKRDKKNNNK